jgi:uncharacterized protein YjiS (DUF1127 family)
MAAMDVTLGFRGRSLVHDLLDALRAGWQTFLNRREERRTIVAISRLGPHLIRDMGLDPERIYEELRGGWDEVDPASFRILLPKDAHIRNDARRKV